MSDHGFDQRADWPAFATTAPQFATFAEAEGDKDSAVLEASTVNW